MAIRHRVYVDGYGILEQHTYRRGDGLVSHRRHGKLYVVQRIGAYDARLDANGWPEEYLVGWRVQIVAVHPAADNPWRVLDEVTVVTEDEAKALIRERVERLDAYLVAVVL